jgi:K+-transporting ATPase KdpF subunit
MTPLYWIGLVICVVLLAYLLIALLLPEKFS